jgi:hypothetical protein
MELHAVEGSWTEPTVITGECTAAGGSWWRGSGNTTWSSML